MGKHGINLSHCPS